MMKRVIASFFFLFIVSSFLIAPANAEDERKWSIEAGIRYTLLTPSGEMGTVNNGVSNESNISDLGLDSAEGAPSLSIAVHYKRARLFFSGQDSGFSGIGTTSRDITQGNITIPAGATVDTSMDIGVYSLIGTYDLIQGKYELGVGVGVMALNFDVSYTAQATGIQITYDDTYPMPLIAVNGTVHWDRFELAALIGGAYIDHNSNTISYLNADLAGRYALYKGEHWSGMVSLGYRYIGMNLDIEQDSNQFKADIDLTGPYLGLRVKF